LRCRLLLSSSDLQVEPLNGLEQETRPEPALLPALAQKAAAAVQRAKVRQLVSIICADTQPLQNSSVLAAIAGDDEEGKAAFARKWIERGLRGTCLARPG
jgi:glutathione S-transferase